MRTLGGQEISQPFRYWPRTCQIRRSITRSETLSRSTRAVASPTGVDDWAVQPKVFVPQVVPGIEESDRATGSVYGRDIRSLVPIAEETRVGEIIEV